MALPKLGTYTSENKQFKIQITSTDSDKGRINAIYESNYSPVGAFTTEEEDIGGYMWVGKYSQLPFSISFAIAKRPENWAYAIRDSWVGAYQAGDTLLMEGVRSYVNSDGVVEVLSLGTLSFSII